MKKVVTCLIFLAAILPFFQSCSYPSSDYLCDVRVGISKTGSSFLSAFFCFSFTGVDLDCVSEFGFWVATIQKYDEGEYIKCSPEDFSMNMTTSYGDIRLRAYAIVDGIVIYSEELYY